MSTIPGNPHSDVAMTTLLRCGNLGGEAGVSVDAALVMGGLIASTHATLALAYEQHQRNRLAVITAAHRGIVLPPDLAALATEGTDHTPATTGHDTKEKNA